MLSLLRWPVPGGGQPGSCYPCFLRAAGAGVGTQCWPHSVPSCKPALRAVGVVAGRPRGGVSRAVVRGRLGLGARPPLAACLWVGQLGPVAHLPWGAGVLAWVYSPSLGRAAGRVCVWCVWCLCGFCVLVGAWWCGARRGSVVCGPVSLCPGPWYPPVSLCRVVWCVPWLGAVPLPRCAPCSGACLDVLARSLPFPLPPHISTYHRIMGRDSVAKSSPQGPRWDLSGVPKELKKPIIDHLVCHRNHLLKESPGRSYDGDCPMTLRPAPVILEMEKLLLKASSKKISKKRYSPEKWRRN